MKVYKPGGRRLFERDPELERTVADMLLDLEKRGLDAVREYSRRFDDWDPPEFELSDAQIQEAVAKVDPQTAADIELCHRNIEQFARAQRDTLLPLETEVRPGVTLGHKLVPVRSVGAYTPGGIYPIFGSAQMSIIPAKTAGVDQVAAFTAPARGVGAHPAAVYAMKKAGADRIFIVGGVQAMAMMAFGMGALEPVDFICGPGNKYVTEAKRQLFGRCGIDLLAGPSEILIIADDDADPALVACDLLAQAEHDPDSAAALVCFSEDFAARGEAEVQAQLADLPTREVAERSWNANGRIVIADDADEAIALSDEYAPEHLELHVRDWRYYFERLRNYGSLFIGEETTVAYGDKSIGTNHILPTSRAARYAGGLWVGLFLKTLTYQRITPAASRALAQVTARQLDAERLPGHARSARRRFERYAD